MDTKIKNYLGIALTVAVLVTALSALNFSYSYFRSVDPLTAPNIRVTGEGKAVAVPDIAQFSFSVIAEGNNIQQIQGDNAKKINQAIDYLKSEGVAKEDIETKSYDLQPRYEYFSCSSPPAGGGGVCPPPRIAGYTLSQTVAVKLRNFDKTGSILAGVVARGANSISQLFFTIDDRTKVESEARAKAIAQAKVKAEAAAEAADVKLGRLLSISEYASYPPPGFEGMGMGGAERATTLAPQVEPGSEEITITVDLIYEIR
ncbi:MAG: SIMPL domain-containing protein [bacterium]|nr:SIMPL domain-containing protein [bacterium]